MHSQAMNEGVEVKSSPMTKKINRPAEAEEAPAISASPPLERLQSPSMIDLAPKTPQSPFLSRLMSTPIASPMKKAIVSMQGYMEQVGNFTKLDPQDAWLPITESRNGNSSYAAFHMLCSGIGVQALVLPLAFTTLGWAWGIVCLSLAFTWQLYTLWLLIQLHESESGVRYSRYLRLAMAAFGVKLGKILVLFPIMYLSGGTCVALIMIGGGTMKIFFQIVCGETCNVKPPTIIEWYLVFTISALLLAQLPNLNSVAGVSLIGAITAVGYCTLIWVVSVAQGRVQGVSYDPRGKKSPVARIFTVLNAFGIVAFAFRGHNLVLEIQGTMPSNTTRPASLPMWKGIKFAYLIIAICLFPLAIGGYWAYGISIPLNGGMLNAMYKYHGHDVPNFLLGLASFLVVINSLSSFQIYAMPVFDNLEFRYTSTKNKPCPRWLRTGFRALFGCLAFFIAVALPFLPSLAGLIGGVALPITLAYPSFMWIFLKKPKKYGIAWCLNLTLGITGMVFSVLVVTGAIWSIVAQGIEIHFFKPQ
ncbi:lysine histidine transporter-like 8 [Quillaja saponaria]|uniref:Lysine histidine transporter-like 8 n=1 Tax=Quillaja saponaria TaxID=32244 RepID=A0AAD7LGZ7_QUISA|nr:lysine histidine transporter-like 8 [Quillaja saponaria]